MKNIRFTFQEFAILKSISNGDGKRYGLEIHRWLESIFGRSVSLGGIYTTLRRLEKKGWIKSEWGGNESPEARRRYYALTRLGKELTQNMEKELVATFLE